MTTLIENMTTQGVDDRPLSFVDVFAVSELILVFLLGTIGNGLVIYIFGWRKRRTRTHFESLLLPLAVNDFLASLIVPSQFVYGTLTRYGRWDFGQFGCKIIPSIMPVTITMSESLLILISFERYRCVAVPFNIRLRKPLLRAWSGATIFLALLLVFPYTEALEMVTDRVYAINTCIPSNAKHTQMFVYSVGNVLRDVTAIAAMVTLGFLSSRCMRTNLDQLKDLRSRARRLRCVNKARKMLVVVVCCFSVCVFPLNFFQTVFFSLIVSKMEIKATTYKRILQANTLLTVLQMANSAHNILIYSKMHHDFKKHCFCLLKRSRASFRRQFSRMTFLGRSRRKLAVTHPPFSESIQDEKLL